MRTPPSPHAPTPAWLQARRLPHPQENDPTRSRASNFSEICGFATNIAVWTTFPQRRPALITVNGSAMPCGSVCAGISWTISIMVSGWRLPPTPARPGQLWQQHDRRLRHPLGQERQRHWYRPGSSLAGIPRAGMKCRWAGCPCRFTPRPWSGIRTSTRKAPSKNSNFPSRMWISSQISASLIIRIPTPASDFPSSDTFIFAWQAGADGQFAERHVVQDRAHALHLQRHNHCRQRFE